MKSRVVDQVDGDLAEIDPKEFRKAEFEKMVAGLAVGESSPQLNYLIKVGERKGYKDPKRWAAHVVSAREANRKLREAGRVV